MNTLLNLYSIRHGLMAAAVVAAISLPLFATASSGEISVAYYPVELNNAQGQDRLYERLKSASRKLCGSADIRVAGSLNQSVANKACYHGTLAAAVRRLDNAAITELHSRQLHQARGM